jgi:hypothetical protein
LRTLLIDRLREAFKAGLLLARTDCLGAGAMGRIYYMRPIIFKEV